MDPEARGTVPLAVPSPMREERKPKQRSKKKCCLWCCGVSTAVIIAVVIILVILIFTVFKARDPELSVDSVQLSGISVNLGNLFTNLNPSVNLSLVTEVTVKNRNYASLKYQNTTAYIFYHGKGIGETDLDAGEIKARKSVQLTLPVNVRITGALINSNLTTDLASGILPIGTQVTIRGTAKVLNIVKLKNTRANSYCDIEIFISNQTLKDINCKNSFKI